MARIVGVDIPRNKKVSYSLRYIHGIGLTTAQKLCVEAKVDPDTRVQDLTEEQVVALRDAISSVTTPAIEVHISNILSREDFRKKSYLSDVCSGIISGLGLLGYEAAIKYFIDSK